MKTMLPALALMSSIFCHTSTTSAQNKSFATNVHTSYGATLQSAGVFPFSKFINGPRESQSSVSGRELDSVRGESPVFGFATASIDARAHAAIGHVGVGVTVAATGTAEGYADVTASADASWQDNAGLFTDFLAIDAPVIANFNILLDGDLSANAFGDGTANGIFDLFDNNSASSLPSKPYPTFNAWGFVVEDPSRSVHIMDQIPGGFRISKTVLNKRTFTLGFGMLLNGQAQSSHSTFGSQKAGSGVFTGDVMHSLSWGGIESITDQFGNEIPRDQWTIVSDSGFDYSQPFSVPEPSAAILFLLASAVITLTRSHRTIR